MWLNGVGLERADVQPLYAACQAGWRLLLPLAAAQCHLHGCPVVTDCARALLQG